MDIGIIEIAAGVTIGNFLTLAVLWAFRNEQKLGRLTATAYFAFFLPIVFLGTALVKNWGSILP